jgi:hypothetical protein
MRRFRKRADLAQVFLPGRGRLRDSDILVGSEYEQFCPSLLEPILEEPAPVTPPAVVASKPPKVETEPTPEVVPEIDQDGDMETLGVAAPRAPDGTWSRKELGEYALGLGIKTTGMTKVELLRAIREKTKS